MPWRTFVRTSVALACLSIAGCGLTLDYGPPSSRDAGRLDAGRIDAGRIDAGARDGGNACRTELDCADGDLCNGTELCVAGVCTHGDPVQCQDHDVCDGTDACDPATGHCVSSAPLACPMDTNPCNGVESCDPVIGCTQSPAPSCDDGIDCTNDSCDATRGCVHATDDMLCTAGPGGTCTVDGCDYPMCIDGVTCVADHLCVTAHCTGGACIRTPIACPALQMCCAGACVPVACDDTNACTDDACDMASGCQHTPRAGACDNHDGCTTLDHCVGTTCTGGPVMACLGSDTCNVGRCAAGICGSMPTSGNPCIDANPCTTGDVCMAGVCTPGTVPARCDDMQPCTSDACDPIDGCTNTPLPDGMNCANLGAPGRCAGGVCETACGVGMDDCDSDGVCECMGTCTQTDGLGLCVHTFDCVMTGCPGGQTCCTGPVHGGMCFDSACAICCR